MSTRTSPKDVQTIVLMREAGWTIASISEKTSVSLSTVQRILKRKKVKAGSKQAELIEASKKKLRDSLIDDESVHEIYASIAADNVSQINLSRLQAAKVFEQIAELKCETFADAALNMRMLAAHATMIKAQSDCLKNFVPLPVSEENLPELIVHIMSTEEEEQMREETRREDERLAKAGMGDHYLH